MSVSVWGATTVAYKHSYGTTYKISANKMLVMFEDAKNVIQIWKRCLQGWK